MSVAASNRREDSSAPLPGDTQAREQLDHGGVVGHQQTGTIDGEGKMAITDFKGDPKR